MKKLFLKLLELIRRLFSYRIWRLLIIIVFISSMVILGLPYIIHGIAGASFGSSSYSNAGLMWRLGSKISFYDRDVFYYNAGNSAYRHQDFASAVSQYEQALKYTDEARICPIKWNDSRALIEIGRQKEPTEPVEAISYYSRAIYQLNYDFCLNQDEYKQKWLESIIELELKIVQINKSMNEKRTSEFEVDPDFKKPSDDDRSNIRQQKLNNANRTRAYNDSKNLSEEDKTKSYLEEWW